MPILKEPGSGLLETVGNGRRNNEQDVKTVRSNLTQMNYRTDEDKAEDIFTRSLDAAIRTFQQDERLEQDGWLEPGGPTEERLRRRLKQTAAPEESGLARTILPALYDEEIISLIKKGEGSKQKLYLDTRGNHTIGTGFMIPNIKSAKTYPFQKFELGEPIRKATSNEIEDAYNLIKRQPYGPEHSAESYQSLTDIGLSESDIDQRLKHKLRITAEELQNKFSDFDNVPKNVQLGLMDMQFNLGDSKFQRSYFNPNTKQQSGWKELFKSYDERDWKKMAHESHRKGIGENRNKDVFELFDKAR